MPRITTLASAFLTLASLMIAGCGNDGSTAQSTAEPTAPTWILASAPEGAQSVTQAKASVAEGERIVLRCRIGGRKEPITAASPVFTVMDLAIPHCGDNPADACRTPWDYCCETPETITANAATVQIVDANGDPITDSPTAYGLAALGEVIVVGTVAPRPSENILTVQATGIYLVGG